MRFKAPLPPQPTPNYKGWGGTRVGARTSTVLGVAKARRPVSLIQAPTIFSQLARLVADKPKAEYTPAEVKASIGPVAHQVRGLVFAMLGWRYRSVRRNKHPVRVWAAPLNHKGIPMPSNNAQLNAALGLAEADRLKNKTLKFIDIWLDTAGATLSQPNKTGRDLNRTGELLLAAGNWLTEERQRIAEAERIRLNRLQSASREAEFKAKFSNR